MSAVRSTASVHLELDSRPESVTLVRSVLAGTAEQLGLRGQQLDDLRTAVSEACNNVVLHAYEDERGPLWVDVERDADEVRVRVLDHGSGIRSIVSARQRMRVGLALIAALSERAEVLTPRDGGTEVRMVFAGGGRVAALAREPVAAPPREPAIGTGPEPAALSGDVVVSLAPAGLITGVLGRVYAVVAARAHFSIDRHADLELVADELGALARGAGCGPSISFAVSIGDRSLELSIGPLAPGSCERLEVPAVSAGGDCAPLALLVDRLEVETAAEGETLRLRLSDSRSSGQAASVSSRRRVSELRSSRETCI